MSASQDVAEQVVRAAPTASVAVLTWMTNIPVNLLVQWVALIFGILQVYVLVRDRIVAPWVAKRQAATTGAPVGTGETTADAIAALEPVVEQVIESAAKIAANGNDGKG